MNYQNVHTPIQHRRRSQVNTGGLCWVVFAKWQDVALWPQVDPLTGQASTPIQLKAGCTWYECQTVDRGRIFTEDMKVSNAGPYWDIKVTGYFGGNNSSHTLASGTMQYHQFVVMFKDRDGQIRFLGNQDTGADVEETYSSGDRDTSRKRNLVFTWEHSQPVPIYISNLDDISDDIIIPPFAGEGDFNNDLNDDFSNG